MIEYYIVTVTQTKYFKNFKYLHYNIQIHITTKIYPTNILKSIY